MTLDDIEDKEMLRRAAKLLEAENQRLAKEIAKLAKELHELKGGDPQQLMLQLLTRTPDALASSGFAPAV